MNLQIYWNNLPLSEWTAKFAQVKRANLLQSYDYARATCAKRGQRGRWGVVLIDGQEAGLVQVLEASLFGRALHAVIIDRGPVWFEGFGSADHVKAFWMEIDRQFPRRFGRKRRFLPEASNDDVFESLGFKKMRGISPYKTLWLDLREDLETLRERLRKNWRGSLQKAEKENLILDWDDTGKTLSWALKTYHLDRMQRRYPGPSVTTLHDLSKTIVPLIGRAVKNGAPVAFVLIFLHGGGATYQVGWTSPSGRDMAAHHILLWDALRVLKERKILDFDLGGIDDDNSGLAAFKEGMGGEKIQISGPFH